MKMRQVWWLSLVRSEGLGGITPRMIALVLFLIGCSTSTPRALPLTAGQAAAAARQLANEKAHSLFDCRPFGDAQPARFVEGHWVWRERRAHGAGDLEANVELGADGSSSRVDVIRLDSRAIRARLDRRP